MPGTVTTQAGIYLQDQIEYGRHWIATLGLRRDRATTAIEGSAKLEDEATTAKAGLMYRFANGIHPHASYSESFQPYDYVDFFGRPYKPLRGRQSEIGVKVQPKNGKTLVTATVFDVREENRLSAEPANAFNSIQLGSSKSRDVSVSDGSRVAGLPLHQASVWGSYAFALADIPGFRLGGGLRDIGRTSDEANRRVTPDLALIDAGAGYTRGPWSVAINAANLEDRSYVASCLSRGDCFYGPRRSVVGRIAYRW